jgi:murein DD-endopeptidase MepM/ murein hydrolase activator NlpD
MASRCAAALALALLLGGNAPPADPPNVERTEAVPHPPATPTAVRIAPTAGQTVQGGWARGNAGPDAVRLTLDGQPVPLAADGSYFVAFDRDAGQVARLSVERTDGTLDSIDIAVAPRDWQIERVNTPMRPGKLPSEEYQRIRAAELARIKAARALDTGAQGWRQAFIAPAQGRFSGRFGSQRIYQGQPGAYHSGLDIAGGAGATIVAPADGTVILAAAAPFTLEGNLIMLDHGMGLNSAFLHCSAILVKKGDRVVQGQPIGRIGATGRATGPHLHWSVKWRDARLDPFLLLPN